MKIFTKEPCNLGRQTEVDLLRGYTALLLVIVHAGLYLGNNIGKGLWTFCDIIGSECAAPVFMVLMGISMVYSHHQEQSALIRRGIRLLLIGYGLNFFRSLLPLMLLGNVDEWTSVAAFFVVDILPFAGLSFLLIALLRRLKLSNLWIFAVSVLMVIVDAYIMLLDSLPWKSEILTGLINLFCPVTEWSCFPLLTWFIFPAFGLICGDLLIRCQRKDTLYAILLPLSLCGVLFVYVQFYRLYPDYTAYYWGNNFYYMGLKNALLTLFFPCLGLSFWFYAGKILPARVKNALSFLSKNLNTYYVISWLAISAFIHAQSIYGWKFDDWATLGMIALLTILCAIATKLWVNHVKKSKPRSRS